MAALMYRQVLPLMAELPFIVTPTDMDAELELAGNRLIYVFDLARDAVLRAYRSGYTPARIAQLTRLSLGTVVDVVCDLDDQRREAP